MEEHSVEPNQPVAAPVMPVPNDDSYIPPMLPKRTTLTKKEQDKLDVARFGSLINW